MAEKSGNAQRSVVILLQPAGTGPENVFGHKEQGKIGGGVNLLFLLIFVAKFVGTDPEIILIFVAKFVGTDPESVGTATERALCG